jgi:hypothetical protein
MTGRGLQSRLSRQIAISFPALIMVALAWPTGQPAAGTTAPPSCPLTAEVTADNDIRLATDNRPPGKEAAVPAVVQRKIHDVAARLLRQVQLSPDWFKCRELYRRVFRINVSSEIYLYLADLYVGSGIEYFVLILYDPATNALTTNPPRIAATSTQDFGWKDALLAPPLISFASLGGNHRQVVFEQRVHNGTVYNAVVYNYFEVGPNLSLDRILALEERALSIGRHEGLIIRNLHQMGPMELRLDTFLQAAGKGGERRQLGYVILSRPVLGVPFRVKERHAIDPADSSILVTYAGPDTPGDDAFLRDGYTFNY